MYTSITVYSQATGKITGVIRCTPDMVDAQTPRTGETFIVGTDSNPMTQYVVNGRVTPRPANTAVCSGTTIYNVATGSSVRVDDRSKVTITNGTAYLEPTPGDRVVRVVSPWPMQEARFEFTV